ncbi:MAG: hypothetical protein KKA79_07630, partial [Nanoarchaeota archaeon]|nr:hypothetical protein [Nanoarchaeota archaeon]
IAKLEENKKLGVIGPRVVSFENKLESLGIRYSVSGLSEVNKSMKNRIFAVHDCASIYRKKALEDIKVNNEYYDTYLNVFSNEADIAFMLRMLNWDLAVDPDTTVQHLHGGSYPHASDRSMFFTYRNRILVILKNMSFSFFLKHIIPIVLIQILIIGAYTLKGKLHLILKSYWSLIKNFKSIMQKRKTLQKRKIISDKELLKFMTKKWYISSKSS